MRPNDATTQRLIEIVEPVCSGAGYELVHLELTRAGHGWVLRVMIDHAEESAESADTGDVASDAISHKVDVAEGTSDSSGIGFDDCERVSRELSAVLDVENPIEHAYDLEVSSPGLDRPLRTLAHFRRFIGHTARIKVQNGLDGRRNFKGTIIALRPLPPASIPDDADAGRADDTSCDANDRRDNQMAIAIETDGQTYELSFDDLDSARLVPDWDVVFAKQSAKQSTKQTNRGDHPRRTRDS